MKTYELTYIISPDITSEEAGAKAKEIESAIQGKEGIILRQSNPLPKTLAFPIVKRASGFFGVLEFQLEPEKLSEIKENIVKDEKIARHMIVIKEPARMRKERRTKRKSAEIFVAEQKTEIEPAKEEKTAHTKSTIEKEKIELKDIEQKLEELLGE